MKTTLSATDNSKLLKGVNGNFLKIFAALTMMLDHFSLTVIYSLLSKKDNFSEYFNLLFSTSATADQLKAIPADFMDMYSIYMVLRLVGKISFPIFCFLLYQGFCHTSNIKKYLLRLSICAVAAEVPLNLIVSRVNTGKASFLYPQIQNTAFSLLLSLLMLICMRFFEAKPGDASPKAAIRQLFGQFLCVILACLAARFLCLDFSYFGPLLVAVFYYFRLNTRLRIVVGCFLCIFNHIAAVLAFFPIALYNGTEIKNRKFQYFFYIFYPAHLLLLYLISLIL